MSQRKIISKQYFNKFWQYMMSDRKVANGPKAFWLFIYKYRRN